MSEKLFEQASREKWRFITSIGALSVEDLWNLPLTSQHTTMSLNHIAQALYTESKTDSDIPDFVGERSSSENTASLKLDLVKYIISVKKEERTQASIDKERASQKARLIEILHEKKDSALSELSVEELEKRIADL